MRFRPDVAAALADRRPVVALESTLIAHGMPFPANVETGRAMENAVRAGGAVPATIALLDGEIVIGLDEQELERLGSQPDVTKVSLRDIGVTLAAGGVGATTVASTMFAADRAGIRVFATGGVGGVHRDSEVSGDVSADMTALAAFPVAVVSAGVKAILDIPRTLETLETLGVPVIGYGTDQFPAFYTRESGQAVPHRADTPAQVAAILHAHWEAGLRSGVLVANPIPSDDEADPFTIEQTITEALTAARSEGIAGKEISPYLLAHVARATDGASLQANIALALANARVGADLAVALSDITS